VEPGVVGLSEGGVNGCIGVGVDMREYGCGTSCPALNEEAIVMVYGEGSIIGEKCCRPCSSVKMNDHCLYCLF
jgi:hypothetical protein